MPTEAETAKPSSINAPVFWISAAALLALVLYASLFQENAQAVFTDIQGWIITNLS